MKAKYGHNLQWFPCDVLLSDHILIYFHEFVNFGIVFVGSGRKEKKKRKSKAAVIEVQEGAHLVIEKQITTTVQSAVPIVGAQDGQVSHNTHC